MDDTERSDGWEAFIPAAPDQAARNEAIWREAWWRLQEERD